MATYLDMITRIADELVNDGDISTAQIKNAILTTIADYAGEAFWFNTKSLTINTGTFEYYSSTVAPTDISGIIRIDSAYITYSGVRASIDAVDNAEIDEIQTGSVIGVPQFYARVFNDIRFYPIPNTSYPVTFSVVYTLPALSADADSNAWTNDAEEVIRQGAKKRIAADILASDEIAARAARMETAAYEGLRAENRNRRSQQYLRTEVPTMRRSFNIYTGW